VTRKKRVSFLTLRSHGWKKKRKPFLESSGGRGKGPLLIGITFRKKERWHHRRGILDKGKSHLSTQKKTLELERGGTQREGRTERWKNTKETGLVASRSKNTAKGIFVPKQ